MTSEPLRSLDSLRFLRHANQQRHAADEQQHGQYIQRIVHAARVRLDQTDHPRADNPARNADRSEEHTSELQSQSNLVCRLLLEKKKKKEIIHEMMKKKKKKKRKPTVDKCD